MARIFYTLAPKYGKLLSVIHEPQVALDQTRGPARCLVFISRGLNGGCAYSRRPSRRDAALDGEQVRHAGPAAYLKKLGNGGVLRTHAILGNDRRGLGVAANGWATDGCSVVAGCY